MNLLSNIDITVDFTLDKLDFKKIYLMAERCKGFKVLHDMNKIRVKTPECFVPFGVEDYNKKEILNVDIINNSNEKQNFIAHIELLENIFKQFSKSERDRKTTYSDLPFIKLSADFLKDISSKEYVHTLKPSILGPVLRTHLNKNVEIFKKDGTKSLYVSKGDLVKKKCVLELELSHIWVYGSNYGLYWQVNKIQVTD